MHDDDRRETLKQLQSACHHATLGAMDRAERHMAAALKRVDHIAPRSPRTKASVGAVRGYIEKAQAAMTESDQLGIVLALVAALQAMDREPRKQAVTLDRRRKLPTARPDPLLT